MAKTTPEMVAEAKAKVPAVTPEEAVRLDNVLFVDVRKPAEVAASGKVLGAINVPRRRIDLQADPSSSSYNPNFSPDKTVVLYCAAGGRAALAGQALQNLGYKDVRNMGGFKDWANKGLPVEK